MSFIDDDLAFALADTGSVPITVNNWTGRGLVDERDVPDVDRSGDPVLVRQTVVRLRRLDHLDHAGAVTISRGDACRIDGVAYTVSDVRIGGADPSPLLELDGRELHLVVRRA